MLTHDAKRRKYERKKLVTWRSKGDRSDDAYSGVWDEVNEGRSAFTRSVPQTFRDLHTHTHFIRLS